MPFGISQAHDFRSGQIRSVKAEHKSALRSLLHMLSPLRDSNVNLEPLIGLLDLAAISDSAREANSIIRRAEIVISVLLDGKASRPTAKDEVSAMLMAIKAEHLYAANIIDDDDRLEVLSRAAAFSPLSPAETPHLTVAACKHSAPPLPAAVVRRGNGCLLHCEGQRRAEAGARLFPGRAQGAVQRLSRSTSARTFMRCGCRHGARRISQRDQRALKYLPKLLPA